MNEKDMIADLVAMLDSGFEKGVGHVNVDVDETLEESKNVETMGCVDCSKNPLACSIPTFETGSDE